MTLTHDRLQRQLRYDPESGLFTRAVNSGKAKAGDVAGYTCPRGYVYVRVDSVRYLGHRLAWFYMTGEWPKDDIDHRDLNTSNNAFSNLRGATASQNMHNMEAPKHNTSGIKGVCFDAATGKWMAYIYVDGRFHNLGRYLLKEDAAAVYAAGARRLFGEFARSTQASANDNADNLSEPRCVDGPFGERTPQHGDEAPMGNPLIRQGGQLRDPFAANHFSTSQGVQ